MWLQRLAGRTALLQAYLARPKAAPPVSDAQPRDRVFRHHDWHTLVTRFTHAGGVDYANFARVRRLLEEYLGRLSFARSELLATHDEQLAFYLNAYNEIAVHQVLLHYPTHSIRDVPAAFARPYPIGRELLSLDLLLHARLRPAGDPRILVAIVPASASAPPLRAYTSAALQQELDEQLRGLLSDPVRGLQLDVERKAIALNPIFRWFAGDFIAAGDAPSLAESVRGYLQPRPALPFLRPYMPPSAAALLDDPALHVEWLPYRWELNSSAA